MYRLLLAAILPTIAARIAPGATGAVPNANNYTWRNGYLAAGDDITSGTYTVEQASRLSLFDYE